MIQLTLIGIGTGNPQHLTQQAVDAIRAQDLILIPNKGRDKDDLAGLRRAICTEVLREASPAPHIVEFELPVRDPQIRDYRQRVDDWHDAIAEVWHAAINAHLPPAEDRRSETTMPKAGHRIGFLVWGDPSLYDSTMRIADRLKAREHLELRVIPGITSMQALTAAHAIPVNEIGAPFLVTTGRKLREDGWPQSPEGASTVDTLIVMLDGECSFQSLLPLDKSNNRGHGTGVVFDIYWTAYAGMKNEISRSGPLSEVCADIIATRAKARADHGWIMDIYLLRRKRVSVASQ